MKNIFTILSVILISSIGFAQTLLLEENFDYVASSNITSNGWANYSGSTGPILVSSGSLSYTNYPSSGVGNSADVIGNASTEDDKRTFTSQTSGSVYVSFLVNFSSATSAANGDYFLGLFTFTGSSTSSTRGRVYVKESGPNIAFGISKAGTTPVLSAFSYSLNTTYLLVLKYTYNGASSDDVISLFINPELSGVEPAPDLINVDVATDLSNVGAIFLRQGSTAYNLNIDGIRVSDSWNQSPLPIELTSFTAKTIDTGILLNWTTATEINNYGFSVEQNSILFPEWREIGFVNGHGNSNSPKNYSFIDTFPQSAGLSAGNSVAERSLRMDAHGRSYRLKQIDTDGSFEYSEEIEISFDKTYKYSIEQNHPNPFNPTTMLNYTIKNDSKVVIEIYNSLGQKVVALFSGTQGTGKHSVTWNATGFSSGTYFARFTAASLNNKETFFKVKKLLLLK